jgi:hypothetical protein
MTVYKIGKISIFFFRFDARVGQVGAGIFSSLDWSVFEGGVGWRLPHGPSTGLDSVGS